LERELQRDHPLRAAPKNSVGSGAPDRHNFPIKSKEFRMARVSIRPLGEKVVVKRLEAESKTAGGIVLPDTAKEKPKQGTVLSVGDGRLLDSGKRQSLQVREGDRVLFSSYAGTEIKVDGQEMIIMDEGDILAVVE
jgi:chaperonin GroES